MGHLRALDGLFGLFLAAVALVAFYYIVVRRD